MRRVILVLVLMLIASAAAAGRLDTTRLFASGAWIVEHIYDPSDGSAWCSASTRNDADQLFSLAAFDFGALALVLGDHRWSLSPRPVRFRLDIDYTRWDIDGTADGSSVMVILNGNESTVDFMRDLERGFAVALYNDDGRRLATFSLRGSAAALGELVTCWTRIVRHDPFRSRADPF
jgi:hypothetical protein